MGFRASDLSFRIEDLGFWSLGTFNYCPAANIGLWDNSSSSGVIPPLVICNIMRVAAGCRRQGMEHVQNYRRFGSEWRRMVSIGFQR